ncbi:hypothetical protein PQX77_006071 [Marasmius sp. AFHP31]|nr:hypothetical protein PQX77_006071 [Marasmius sp. AFHP31]
MSKPTQPIPIPSRDRSASVSSAEDQQSPRTPSPQSPSYSPRVALPSPGSSPILSYFLAQSPTAKSAPGGGGNNSNTFPFRKFTSTTAPVFEEDVEEPHSARHARRASTTVADRFNQPQPPSTGFDRGSGLLRRLSLSTATAPPQHQRGGQQAPPNSAVSPSSGGMPFPPTTTTTGRVKRSNTLAVDTPKQRRAPSPMGERILKGHFDGFN